MRPALDCIYSLSPRSLEAMRRFSFNSLKPLAGLLLFAFLGLYFSRLVLLESLLTMQLERLGVPESAVIVEEISFHTLELARLSLGSERELEADRLVARWTLSDLFKGELQSLDISGLQLLVDLTGEKPPLGSLQQLIAGESDTVSGVLPQVSLKGAKVLVRTGTGIFTVKLNGDARSGPTGDRLIALDIETDADASHVAAKLSATLNTDRVLDESRLEVEVDIAADIDADSFIWSLFGLPRPVSGSGSLSLTADGTLPSLQMVVDDWVEGLQQGTLQSSVSLSLSELDFEDRVSRLNADITLNFELYDGVGNIILAQNSSVDGIIETSDGFAGLGIPRELGATLGSNAELRIESKDEISGKLTLGSGSHNHQLTIESDLRLTVDESRLEVRSRAALAMSPQGKPIEIDVNQLHAVASGLKYAGHSADRVTVGGAAYWAGDFWRGELELTAEIKSLDLASLGSLSTNINLPLLVGGTESDARLSLAGSGEIVVTQLAPSAEMRLLAPLLIDLRKSTVDWFWGANGVAMKSQVTLQPSDFRLRIENDDPTPLELKFRPGEIVHSSQMDSAWGIDGRTDISATDIAIPNYQILLENISAIVRHKQAGEGHIADFAVGRLVSAESEPYFDPISVSGAVTLIGERLSMSALGGLYDQSYLQLDAVHQMSSGEGELQLNLGPLTFSPDSLQPESLFPALEMLESVSGAAIVSSHFNWLMEDLSSGANISVQDLSFSFNETRVEGLSAVLQLSDVLLPRSHPQQSITVQQINPGIPMRDVNVTYSIQGEESVQLFLDHADLSILGGSLSLEDAVIDPSLGLLDVVLQVSDLDLEALFKVIDIEGLAGEGVLGGSIPLIIEGDAVSIQSGVLTAARPGVLRFESDTVSKLLAGNAAELDLLLRALTEFNYTELELKLNSSATGELVSTLAVLGSNPNVLDGRLFRLNINLESNISDVLDIIGEAYGLSNRAIERALRLR